MFVEFGDQLVNSIYFGKVEKLDIIRDSQTIYSLRYELTNGSQYIKEFDSETDRNSEYDDLKTE